ncbi:MAG: HAD-IB family hydrolase [bacterium]
MAAVQNGVAVPQADPGQGRGPDPSAAAFFDVDNTMMVGASMFYFAKGLAARKFFSSRDLAGFVWKQVRFRVGGESAGDMVDARESALAFVAGKSVADIVAVSQDIYDENMAGKIWSGTRALAERHLEAGQRVWLVTATPQELAQIIAERLELTGALGTRAEARDGVYTGHLVDDVLHGQAKAAAVRALAEREGLDLARCSAYSDSINDLPLLRLVGHPVAVNPDSALRAEARAQRWDIRDFRTGRRAARAGLPGIAVAGAGVGVVVGVTAVRRRAAVVDGRRQRSVPSASTVVAAVSTALAPVGPWLRKAVVSTQQALRTRDYCAA